MIAPLDLTTEEFEIYRLLYSKMDFDTFEVKYTLEQLAKDSNIKLDITKKKANNIMKKFIKNNLVEVSKIGSKGNPTIYKMIKLCENQEHKGNELGTQRELKGNTKGTNKHSEINVLDNVEERKGNAKGTQKERIGNTKGTPINDKEKEKENIYVSEIFNYWNNIGAGIKHQNLKTYIKPITTALKKYKLEEIKLAISRLAEAYKDQDYFYNNKWELANFLKQENGIRNWLDEGQYWNMYLGKRKNANKPLPNGISSIPPNPRRRDDM